MENFTDRHEQTYPSIITITIQPINLHKQNKWTKLVAAFDINLILTKIRKTINCNIGPFIRMQMPIIFKNSIYPLIMDQMYIKVTALHKNTDYNNPNHPKAQPMVIEIQKPSNISPINHPSFAQESVGSLKTKITSNHQTN